MAESEHSSSVETSVNSQQEGSTTSKEPAELAFSEDEKTLVIRMYNLVGESWSLIAGRIPGRTAAEIEKVLEF
ncbi:hypothetical protein RHMOL_Rhmol13G0207800 [Rhododendron molle]|uniref:Uncharacterized protein n=1 Tax=Rhododendron molle TaxID=49168 RepID=A0ACC0L9E5_RHOML|nr:hypothetical protein RHMOL_Rhmol13G0207800 [Rhododendron molle]